MKDFYVILSVLIIMIIFFGYKIFEIWYRPRKTIHRARKSLYKYPDWYPFKGFSISVLNEEKGIIILSKILLVFTEVSLVFILIYFLVKSLPFI